MKDIDTLIIESRKIGLLIRDNPTKIELFFTSSSIDAEFETLFGKTHPGIWTGYSSDLTLLRSPLCVDRFQISMEDKSMNLSLMLERSLNSA